MRIEHLKILLLLLLVSLHLLGCEKKQEMVVPSGKVVKIGFVGPISGESSGLGGNSLFGVETALQFQPYLLNGDRPEIIVEDDQNNPDFTSAAIKKLIEEDGVSAILLGSTSRSVLSVTSLIEEHKVPVIALLATHPEISKGSYTTQLMFDDKQQGTVVALFVLDELIVDRVTVFVQPDGIHSVFLAETFYDTFVEAGGEAELIEYPPDSNELEKVLLGLKKKGEEFLYLPLYGPNVVELEMICQKLDYHPQVMLSDGVLSRIILDFDNDLSHVEGMMATDVYSSDVLTKEYGEKLVKSFEGLFTATKTTYTGLGAEGMSILLGAMDRCGSSKDSECINRNLHTTDGFIGVNSKITINREGKTERPIFINKIVNSKLKFDVIVY